jgi:hypothetical protein
VIAILDGDCLNLSPLRGHVGVRFVTTSEELAESLRTVDRGGVAEQHEEFFILDRALPRWKRLLSPAPIPDSVANP